MENVTNAFWDSFVSRKKGNREPMVLHLRNLALFEEPVFRIDPSSFGMLPFMELAALLKKPSSTWSRADWDTFMYWHTKNQEWLAAYKAEKGA